MIETVKDFLREYVDEFGRDDTEEIIEIIMQILKIKCTEMVLHIHLLINLQKLDPTRIIIVSVK